MDRLTARDVMTHPVLTVRPGTSIPDLVRLLAAKRISGVPVVDRLHRVVGIVTEGDILQKEADAGGIPLLAFLGRPFASSDAAQTLERVRGSTVGDVMVTDVITADQGTSLRELARLMARHRVNRIPIVRNGHAIGIVTRADVLQVFAGPDDTVRAGVHAALREARVASDRLRVDVQDHVVRLSGILDDARDRTFIATLVRQVEGVTAVDVSELAVPS